jgi:hypothetical protein
MKLKSISVIKHPPMIVWTAIRDRLTEIVRLLDDIEEVTVQSREELPDGIVRLVNIWRAKPNLPAIVANHIKPEMLAWTDRAEYHTATLICSWKLEPHFFPEKISCVGVTRYEPAMGGRGTRVTFDADFNLAMGALPGVPPLLQEAVSKTLEPFMTALVPRNFRKLMDALEKSLSRPAAGHAVARPPG